jgi:hypothetical protein
MPVYMVRVNETGPVKIGFTAEPVRRLKIMQSNYYDRIHMIRLFEGGEMEEYGLHVLFDDLRLRGEWFTFDERLLGDVGLVEIAAPSTDYRPNRRNPPPKPRNSDPIVLKQAPIPPPVVAPVAHHPRVDASTLTKAEVALLMARMLARP